MIAARFAFLPAIVASLALVSSRSLAADPPRARAIEFDQKVVFRSDEQPGFAAWVQLWREPKGDLMTKCLLRRQPKAGEAPPQPRPFDPHLWEAIGLPAKYDFSKLINETVYLRSRNGGATWTESHRGSENEIAHGPNAGRMSPIVLPDGRLLSLSWGMPGTETDFCEMPSGDLLFIHHKMFAGPGGAAHRQLVRKTRDGWVVEDMEPVGDLAPEIFLRTRDGYLVGASRNAAYVWSQDDGVAWHPVEDIPSCEYQPRAIALDGDRLMFAWHKGGDLPYGQADMYIGRHTFKLQVLKPRPRSRLTLSRVFDEKAGRYVCAFDATLTTGDGKPIANKPIEFSIVARDAAGYEPFGGATPWVHGKKQAATTDERGVARVSYPEQAAIADIHQTFQVAARFDPDGADAEFLPATSLTVEYYAVTPP